MWVGSERTCTPILHPACSEAKLKNEVGVNRRRGLTQFESALGSNRRERDRAAGADGGRQEMKEGGFSGGGAARRVACPARGSGSG